MKYRGISFLAASCCIFLTLLALLISTADASDLQQLRDARKKLAEKTRCIFVNDGNDATRFPRNKEVNFENFVDIRLTAVLNTSMTSISYCPISSCFGSFTYNTKIGDVISENYPSYDRPETRNAVADMLQLGADPLKWTVDFCKQHRLESFFSFRMNDTHDYETTPDQFHFHFSDMKKEHPEYLVGKIGKKTRFGRWSAVNYDREEIRELAFRFFEEVCQHYDVDGIEMDFFRHMMYFKTAAEKGGATDAEIAKMSELVRRIRNMTETEGLKRGRPILLSIRVPDDPQFAKKVGLDFESWMKEGWVDFVIGSDYYQIHPWTRWVALGKKYDIPMYAGISDPRVKNTDPRFPRRTSSHYRARCAAAWEAGVNGLYIFNAEGPGMEQDFFKECGDPKLLKHQDKTYFATDVDGNMNRDVLNGSKYRTIPILVPNAPWTITAKEVKELPMFLGERWEPNEKVKITAHCLFEKPTDPTEMILTVNGKKAVSGTATGLWIDIPVDPSTVRPRENVLSFQTKTQSLKLKDFVLVFDYE